jgi:hypothetical protein
MEKICEECWNIGCKNDEVLIKSKIDVCKHMQENPEEWEDYDKITRDEEERY